MSNGKEAVSDEHHHDLVGPCSKIYPRNETSKLKQDLNVGQETDGKALDSITDIGDFHGEHAEQNESQDKVRE